MPIINTIRRAYPGFGSPSVWNSNQNFNITNGNTVVSIPVGANVQAGQNGIGPVTVGMVRIKTEASGALVNTGNSYPNSTLFRIIQITGDDAKSNTVQLYQGDAAQTSGNQNIDYFFDFACDLPLANINVTINVQNVNSTGNAVMSVEVAAGP